MSSSITKTSIANRALQLLGYKPIGSLNDNDRGAKAMNRAYQPCLLATLRSNTWTFSIARAVLPAATNAPAFGPAFYFNLPPDYVMMANPDQQPQYTFGAQPANPYPNGQSVYNDWQVENNNGVPAIASDQPGPLNLRYVSSNITEALFDPSFAEAFSANLAVETCEELTQSNTKLQDIGKIYIAAIEDAKKRNAFEKKPARPPIDPYILSRM